MRCSRQFTRLTGAPSENEGIRALPANPIVREATSRSGRGKSSRGPRRPFKISREIAYASRMSINE